MSSPRAFSVMMSYDVCSDCVISAHLCTEMYVITCKLNLDKRQKVSHAKRKSPLSSFGMAFCCSIFPFFNLASDVRLNL